LRYCRKSKRTRQRVCTADATNQYRKTYYSLGPEVFALNNPLPLTFQILHSIQKLTDITYLTKLNAGDQVKVSNFMTEAEAELAHLKDVVLMLAQPTSHQKVN
jgi:hypothetical protein